MNPPAPASSDDPPPLAKAAGKHHAPMWIVGMALALPWVALVVFLALLISGGIGLALEMQSTCTATPRGFTEGKVRSLEAALMNFKIQNGFIPSQTQGLEALVTLPNDPRVKVHAALVKPEALIDTWDRKMQYRNPGTHNPKGYDVFSFGPDGVESADDIGNW